MGKKKLNIGCGDNLELYPDYDGLDLVDFGQIFIGDVLELLPKFFHKDGIIDTKSNDLYDEVMANHFLEHFNQDELKVIFNSVHGILKEGGLFKIVVPHKKKDSAWQLSHKTFWTESTFEYLVKPIFERYDFGKWEIEKLVTNKRGDIHAWLRNIK